MINNPEAFKAMKVDKISDLTDAFKSASDLSFHIYVVPGSGAAKDSGETIIINAKPAKNLAAVDVPVCIGDWSPIVFESISASADQTELDLSSYDVYFSEIENY